VANVASSARNIRARFTSALPGETFQVDTIWPSWRYAGAVDTIWYLSDKWRLKGNKRKYYHDTTCHLWLPGRGGRAPRPRPGNQPMWHESAVLADFAGCDMVSGTHHGEGDILCAAEVTRKLTAPEKRQLSQHILEFPDEKKRPPLWLGGGWSAPTRGQAKKTFLLVLDGEKMVALFEGDELQVLKEGIDG
jgi:hypothetical protein